jgi:hypothetical protein
MNAYRLWLTFGLGCLLGLPGQAPSQEPLQADMIKLAKKIKLLLDVNKLPKAVAPPKVSGPGKLAGAVEDGVQKLLEKALEAVGVQVTRESNTSLHVRYSVGKELDKKQDTERDVVRCKCELTDAVHGKDFEPFVYTIEDANAIAFLIGGTGAPGGKTVDQVASAVVAQFLKPSGPEPIDKDGIVWTGDYGIQIRISDKPVVPEIKENKEPHVTFRPNQEFAVVLHNRGRREAAVFLTLDGVSVFTRSTVRHEEGGRKGSPRLTHILVPAGGSTQVGGWHKDFKTIEPFVVVPRDKAVNPTARLASIKALFSAAWPAGEKAPEDEPRLTQSGAGHGIGAAQERPQDSKEVARTIGTVRGIVEVRYQVPSTDR